VQTGFNGVRCRRVPLGACSCIARRQLATLLDRARQLSAPGGRGRLERCRRVAAASCQLEHSVSVTRLRRGPAATRNTQRTRTASSRDALRAVVLHDLDLGIVRRSGSRWAEFCPLRYPGRARDVFAVRGWTELARIRAAGKVKLLRGKGDGRWRVLHLVGPLGQVAG
jgi:hypothetical protein